MSRAQLARLNPVRGTAHFDPVHANPFQVLEAGDWLIDGADTSARLETVMACQEMAGRWWAAARPWERTVALKVLPRYLTRV